MSRIDERKETEGRERERGGGEKWKGKYGLKMKDVNE